MLCAVLMQPRRKDLVRQLLRKISVWWVLVYSDVQTYMNNLEAAVVSLQNILQIDSDNIGLRAGVNLAIFNFLEANFVDSKKLLHTL